MRSSGARQPRDVVVLEVELAEQEARASRGDIPSSTSSRTARPKRRRRSSISTACEEVVGLVLEGEVGVAGDAERPVVLDDHAREERVELRGDHLLERHEARAVGQRQEPGQQRRHLDPGEALLAVLRRRCTRTARFSDRLEMYGNGWPGSTASGVSTGKMRCSNTSIEVLAVVLVEVVPRRSARSPAWRQRRHHAVEEDAPPAAWTSSSTRSLISISCWAGVRPSGLGRTMPGRHLVLEGGHAHLEELVEVRREDGAELGPLEQRHGGVVGQGEHPRVEVEPGELTVEDPPVHVLSR